MPVIFLQAQVLAVPAIAISQVLGIGWKTYRLDTVINYHQQLGFTPELMIEFDFKEKTKKEEE